ncbi:hypothetical protein [Streptomyces afghaniensis]
MAGIVELLVPDELWEMFQQVLPVADPIVLVNITSALFASLMPCADSSTV